MKEKREKLANLAHCQWSSWWICLLEKSKVNKNGELTVPKGLVEKWTKQANIRYKDLSEKEKESDRIEANRVIRVLTEKEDRIARDIKY